jgi:hypothetical protein
MAWMIFVNPVDLPYWLVLWLIIPLCVSVGVVYKTLRTAHPRLLPRELGSLMVYMIGGLVLLGATLWVIQAVFV